MSALSSSLPHGLMFHHFHGGTHARGQGSISGSEFEGIIEHYRERILSADEWSRRVISESLQKGDVCITFDDALACQIDVALPVLQKYGITAFWFVYTSIFDGEIELLEVLRRFRNEAFDSVEDFYVEFERVVDGGEFAILKKELIRNYDHANWAAYPFYTMGDTKFRFIRDEVLGQKRYEKVMTDMISQGGHSIACLKR